MNRKYLHPFPSRICVHGFLPGQNPNPPAEPTMAEVLGIVASSIAVVQGAQVLSQAVLSLSRLWGEVRDVPETIRHLVEDLELSGQIVAEIETELLRSSPESLSTAQRLVIERCRQAHRGLSDLVDDLGADIASLRRRKKLLARVKVLLKKDALEKYEKRLQRAWSLLNFAVQLHMT